MNKKEKNKGQSECMSTIPLWYGDLAERKEGGTTTNTNISYLIFIYIYSRCVGFLYNPPQKKKGYFLVMVHSSFDSDDQPGDPFLFSDLVLTQNDIFSIQLCGNGLFYIIPDMSDGAKKKKSISNQNSRGKKRFNFAKSHGI